MPQRKVSRRNTKRKTKKTTKRLSKKHLIKKRLSKKQSKKINKKTSTMRGENYTGKRLLPRRAIIFPEPIMDGGGVDKEMLGL